MKVLKIHTTHFYTFIPTWVGQDYPLQVIVRNLYHGVN